MAAILLDTTVLIDALRGRRAAERLLSLRRTEPAPWVSAVNVEEIARIFDQAADALAGVRARGRLVAHTMAETYSVSARWLTTAPTPG